MQLILETQPVEDIKINMSTQAESQVNRDVGDVKKELNCENKENDLIIGDGIIVIPEKDYKIDTGIALPSETNRETVELREAIYPESTSQINKINLDIIDKLQNEDLTENINTIITQPTTNGKYINQDEKESENEIPNENAVSIANCDIDVKGSTDEKSIKLAEQNEISILKNEVLSSLELPIPNETSKKSDDECDVNSEHSQANIIQETEFSLQEKGTIETNTKIFEQSLSEEKLLSEKENFNRKEPINTAFGDESKPDADAETDDNAVLITDSFCNGDISIDDNSISIDAETHDPPEILKEIAKSSELLTSNEKEISNIENVAIIDVKHPENYAKEGGVIVEPCEQPEDVDMADEPKVHNTVLETKLAPLIHEQLEDVVMCEVKDTNPCTGDEDKQNPILSTEETGFIAMHVEKLSVLTIEETLKSEEYVAAIQENSSPGLIILDPKLLHVTEERHDVIMKEPVVAYSHSFEQEKNQVVESYLNVVPNVVPENNETASQKTNNENNKTSCEEKKNMKDGIDVEYIPMEVDCVEIIDVDKEQQTDDDKNKTLSNAIVSNESNVVDIIEPNPMLLSNTVVSSETNVVDITEQNPKSSSNAVVSSETNVVDIIEQNPKSLSNAAVSSETNDADITEQNLKSLSNAVVSSETNVVDITEKNPKTLSNAIVGSEPNVVDITEQNSQSLSNEVVNSETNVVDITKLDPNSFSNPVLSNDTNVVDITEPVQESLSNAFVSKETNVVDIIEPDPKSLPNAVVSNETNVVDITEPDPKSLSNAVVSSETNVVHITKPDPKSEIISNKSKTEQLFTNADLKVKDKTDALTQNKTTGDVPIENKARTVVEKNGEKEKVLDKEDIKTIQDKIDDTSITIQKTKKSPELNEAKVLPVVCTLSNTLDILSDDDDEEETVKLSETVNSPADKQCINIDDDDDIMLIEEDSNSKDATNNDNTEVLNDKIETQPKQKKKTDLDTCEKNVITTDITDLAPKINEKDSPMDTLNVEFDSVPQTENISDEEIDKKKPLLPQNFLKTAKKNLADMTRHELEDFCILRIVESIVDRTNLSDIKTKIKTMAQNLEEYRKRATMLTKQNRDLQVVLKSVQEEQKKRTHVPLQPLKITRSVGMQVLMNDKVDMRRKGPIPTQPSPVPAGRPARALQNTKNTKPPAPPAAIPVPRKVPVSNSPAKALTNTPTNNTGNKIVSPNPNGLRNPSPVQKVPEKRTHNRMQATSSDTVDLTDDEPPSKMNNSKMSPVVPPVRVVPPQNLMAQLQKPFSQPLNNPRKVYIPISGPQSANIRPGQTLMMKNGPSSGPRQRVPSMPRMPQSPIRINKQVNQRHPAPLPDVVKQYTPPTWKSLPPAPDLKLSKVENGIVISWKIDGYPEGGYETIASYQLYAYQETTAPPCTALWKKIGDVKALPLPMACTLTQFMAGFKYYFAVRAVDIRSRLGPFSLPGSILLLNKV